MSEKDIKKYIQKMKVYTANDTNFSPTASSISLRSAGILDKKGDLKEPYRKK